MKRLPNGYGGIVKLSGKRRRPYMAYINHTVITGENAPRLKEMCEKAQLLICEENNAEKGSQALAEIFAYKPELMPIVLNEIKKQCKFKSSYKKEPIGYYATQKEAQLALAEYNRDPYDLTEVHTFADVYKLAYADARIEEMSTATVNGYRAGYNKCATIHGRDIQELKLNDLQRIIESYGASSKSTQTKIINVFHLTYDYAMKHDMITKDYSQYVKATKKAQAKHKNVFTAEEIALLRAEAGNTINNTPMADYLLVMIYTGVRIGEFINIKCDDINNGIITVHGTKTNAADRLVPIHPDIVPVIDRLTSIGGEYLAVTPTGKKWGQNNLRNSVLERFNAAHKMAHTFHETRHTFATYSVGMDPVIRSFIIGHSTGSITNDIYTHASALTDKLKDEILKLEIPC